VTGRPDPRSPIERIQARVEIDDFGCWNWTGALTSNLPGKGYGRIQVGPKLKLTHRVAYEALVGPIPEGLDLDHLCRNRKCCNPAHLEPVTRRENLLRGDTLTAAHHEGRDCGNLGCKSCRRHHVDPRPGGHVFGIPGATLPADDIEAVAAMKRREAVEIRDERLATADAAEGLARMIREAGVTNLGQLVANMPKAAS
jgi:hypothetical protein